MNRKPVKKGPIVRRVYSDPFEVKKDYPKIDTVYETFLYKDLKKGSMPKYKLIGLNKDKVIKIRDELIEKYNYKSISINSFNTPINASYVYEIVQVLDLETGEISNE